jgi:type II secretory pathway pseudopilin PulG
MLKHNKSESGRSMIEMLGVLAIMSIITVGAFTMVSNAMKSQNRMRVQDDVSIIVQNVRMMMQEYQDFSNLDSSILFNAINMSKKNPYNGEYDVYVNPDDNRQFIVAIGGLSSGDCNFFRQKGWSESVEYIKSEKKSSGATATPSDCSDANGNNTILINFAQ